MLDFLLGTIQFFLALALALFIVGGAALLIFTDVLDPSPGQSERELNDRNTINNATEYRDDFAH